MKKTMTVAKMIDGKLVSLFKGLEDESLMFIGENNVSKVIITSAELIQPKNWNESEAWAKASANIHTYKVCVSILEKILKNSNVIEHFNGKVYNARFDKAMTEIDTSITLSLNLENYQQHFGYIGIPRTEHKKFSFGLPRIIFRGSDNEELEYQSHSTDNGCNIYRDTNTSPMIDNDNRIISENIITNIRYAITKLKNQIKTELQNKNTISIQKKFDKFTKMKEKLNELYYSIPSTFREVNNITL